MPFIFLPPLGGDKRGGAYIISLLSLLKIPIFKKGETHAPILEFIDNCFIRNYKKKL